MRGLREYLGDDRLDRSLDLIEVVACWACCKAEV